MARLETVRAKHLRRRILECLRASKAAGGEGWVSARTAFAFLSDEVDALTLSETVDEMVYLAGAEKRYAATRDVRERRTEPAVLQARILPKGVDLLEGTIPADPGVEDDRP